MFNLGSKLAFLLEFLRCLSIEFFDFLLPFFTEAPDLNVFPFDHSSKLSAVLNETIVLKRWLVRSTAAWGFESSARLCFLSFGCMRSFDLVDDRNYKLGLKYSVRLILDARGLEPT